MAIQEANPIVQVLKDRGLRVTPQRYAVYANLLGRMDHPTVDQILGDLNQDFPVSSQATVYSSLQALRSVNLVREVLLEEGISRYDANVEAHHHFRCQCCGAIEDIPWDVFENLCAQKIRPGLQVDRFEVTVYGLCENCGV
jgi:Fur family transcriptional regulator, peroxide stress response regulator